MLDFIVFGGQSLTTQVCFRRQPNFLYRFVSSGHCVTGLVISLLLFMSSFFRAAVQKKSQNTAGCSVGASPTTPQTPASIFHTPSPSPTFRAYPTTTQEPIAYPHQLIPQLNNNPAKFGQSAPAQPYLIQPYQNNVQLLGQMNQKIIFINNAPYAQPHGAPPQHHHHFAQNVQNVFTN